MQRKLAKIAYWTAGILVGTVVLLSVALSFLDWNQYRGTLAALASERLGMRVDLAGDIKIGLIPRPAVSAESVHLSPQGTDSSEVVATADRIEMQLGLSALLSGKIAVANLNLDGLSVIIEEKPAGVWKVKGWPDNPEAAETDSAPTAIQLDRLQLMGGKIEIQPFGQPARRIEGLSFRLSGLLPTGPLEWTGEFVTAGEKVTSSGRLRPSKDRDDTAFKTDIGLGGAVLSVSGRLGDVDGGGRVQLNGDNLAKFVATVQKVATGDEAAPLAPAVPFGLDLEVDRNGSLTRVASRQLALGDTQGRLDLSVAEQGDKPHVTGTLALGIIDLQPWLDALAKGGEVQPVQKPSTAPVAALSMPLTGTLDISVEALRFAGDAIQHLDAVVGVAADDIYMTGLHGLLPGGSTLAFQGHIGAMKGGEGKFNFASGNLQQLLHWAGADLSGSVQPGRLATAELAAQLRVSPENWLLYGLDGKVDTMKLSGAMSGSRTTGLPALVTLTVDQINLDAYMAPSKSDEAVDLAAFLPPQDIKFDLQAGAMAWQGKQYKGIRLRGQVGPNAAVLEQGDIHYLDGWVAVVGGVRRDGKDWATDVTLALEKWRLPFVRALVPTAWRYLDALSAQRISGQVTLAGPTSGLRLSGKIDQEAGDWVLNGTVGLKDGAPGTVNLQGNFNHKDLGPLMRLMGMAEARNLPAALTFSASRATAETPISVRVSGDMAGGQLITDGALSEKSSKMQLTYDHKVAAQAFRRLGLGLNAPEPAQPIRADITLAMTGDDWRLDDINVRNGGAQVRGALAGNTSGKVGGSLALTGYRVQTGALGEKSTAPDEEFQMPTGWEGFAGTLNLAIENLTATGQRLDAKKASLVMGDGLMRFDLGEGAKLNGQPAVAKFDLTGGTLPKMKAQLKLSGFDVASFFKAQKLGVIANGTAAVDFNFEAAGNTGLDLLKTIKGRGSMTGGVGALNFLAVPKLVKEMSSAQSGTSFLRNIGGMLRGGQTDFSRMEVAFTLDSGVALVETLKASGDWGTFGLDGQVNLLDRLMDMKGELALTAPADTPAIPVSYKGSLTEPTANWTSRALESFAISGIERRIRSSLFKEQEAQAAGSDKPAASPGTAAFGSALDMLLNLKKKQEEAKRKEEEKAAEKPKDSNN